MDDTSEIKLVRPEIHIDCMYNNSHKGCRKELNFLNLNVTKRCPSDKVKIV